MLFHTGTFVQFFVAFLLLFHLCRNNLRWRNILVVVASYIFYGWWDFRFLSLLVISSLVDYCVGLGFGKISSPRGRRWLLGVSLVGNLGLLGFFKYYGFFIESFAELLSWAGLPFHPWTLNIVLPVGISFYTFQTMSYTIDVYRGEMPPVRNLVQFLAYVSFFPQLVAGPIERARHLLPQFGRTLVITPGMVAEGGWLIVWGFFKKVAVADNLAPLVEMVYDNPDSTGMAVFLGTLAFAFQIYCDFSGYSDIARGLGRTLGFELMFNFNIPYAAKNVREFWSRWHISLSTWLRDYLYVPLGGNRRGPVRTHVNLLTTMLLGGLWHGASWNFVLWGLWHGLGLMAHRVWMQRSAFRLPGWLNWTITFLFVLYGWLLFRAGSFEQISRFTASLLDWRAPAWLGSYLLCMACFVFPLIAVEIWQWRAKNLLAPVRLGWMGRSGVMGVLGVAILLFWEKETSPFIYFQF